MQPHRIRATFIPMLAALALAACNDGPLGADPPAFAGKPTARVGNGFPQGSHDYRVNIIGVPKDKQAVMDDNNGRRIFVQLYSSNTVTSPGGKNNQLAKGGGDDKNHIYLCNSTNGENDVNDPRCDAWRVANVGQFGVIDANATDGNGAILGIPDPCADAAALTPCTPSYRIYSRGHGGGPNGGSATLTTCADESLAIDPLLNPIDDVWCGSNGITVGVSKKASEITSSLLRMSITVDGTQDPALATCLGTSLIGAQTLDVYLFDDCFENYFWNYDNKGLKLLEVRFYRAT